MISYFAQSSVVAEQINKGFLKDPGNRDIIPRIDAVISLYFDMYAIGGLVVGKCIVEFRSFYCLPSVFLALIVLREFWDHDLASIGVCRRNIFKRHPWRKELSDNVSGRNTSAKGLKLVLSVEIRGNHHVENSRKVCSE